MFDTMYPIEPSHLEAAGMALMKVYGVRYEDPIFLCIKVDPGLGSKPWSVLVEDAKFEDMVVPIEGEPAIMDWDTAQVALGAFDVAPSDTSEVQVAVIRTTFNTILAILRVYGSRTATFKIGMEDVGQPTRLLSPLRLVVPDKLRVNFFTPSRDWAPTMQMLESPARVGPLPILCPDCDTYATMSGACKCRRTTYPA